MCDVLEVSTSGFYAWKKRKDAPPTPREQAKQKRRDLIEELFNESRRIYGYRKVHAVLRKRGLACSPNTVHADYKRRGLKSVVKKKHRICTTDSKHNLPVAKNVLNRDFTASKPNEKWVTDITYVETLEGWLFVVSIIDLFSRKVVGYAMANLNIILLFRSLTRQALRRKAFH